MGLSSGTRLGAYEIVSHIGAGGMGEVYRARDTKLDRDVALKILPEVFARDPERLSRFAREAKHLAALNHPNIAQIYGVEDSTAIHALVMEFVPGRTVDAMLSASVPGSKDPGLHLQDALAIARQLADALEAAHEAGIIHRDLKPANIKVRDDGTVKVLDFGLAKAFDPAGAHDAGAGPPLSNSPTMLSPTMTQQGIILGTAPYMSPEQARGRAADKRTDVWAFGVVLYEMLTGRRLFTGESVSDAVAAVLRQDIDLGALPVDLPPAVRQLIARCLDRDQKTRLRDIGEARIALDQKSVTALPSAPAAGVAPAHRASRASLLPWTIAALAVVGAAAFAWSRLGTTAQSAPWDHFTQLTDQTGEETNPTLSPDGASVAYASRARGSSDIYVQRVGGRNAQIVAGDPARDENAPAFSPDGRQIAFHESDADGGIFIVGATGESAHRLTDFGFDPAWSPDGHRIAFASEEVGNPYIRNSISAIWIADVSGGAPVKISDSDAVQPTWSPDGQRIAFWSAIRGQRDISTIAVTGGPPTAVTSDLPLDWSPVWAPDGWLYFSSDRGGSMNLWRIKPPASPGALGAPEPVTLGVQASVSQPSFSHDGSRIVFRAMLQATNPASIPFDPTSEQIGAPKLLFHRTSILVPTSISRDGRWLALDNLGERQEDIFICRIDGSDLTRLIDDAARDRQPNWSPDGSQLAFYSNRSGRYQIWAVGRDGGGLRQVTDSATDELFFPIYRPSTNRMIASGNRLGRPLYEFDPARPWADQKGVEIPLPIKADTSYGAVALSPDGKHLSGTLSNAAGIAHGVTIFDLESRTLRTVGSDVASFVSAWLPDSRRLIIVTADGHLVLYDVDSGRRRELPMPPGVRITPDALVVSPDGRTIYVGILERESDIWMVERSKH